MQAAIRATILQIRYISLLQSEFWADDAVENFNKCSILTYYTSEICPEGLQNTKQEKAI